MFFLDKIIGKLVYLKSDRIIHNSKKLSDIIESVVLYDMNDSNLNFGYTTGIQFPTTANNSVNRTGLPDLTEYAGRKITLVCQYGTSIIFVGTGIVGNNISIQLLSGYNDSRDLWMPKLSVGSLTSATWTLYYDNSFILLNSNNTISKDIVARTFNIIKVVVE